MFKANFDKKNVAPEKGSVFSWGLYKRGRHDEGCRAPQSRRSALASPRLCGSLGLLAPCSYGKLEVGPLQVEGGEVEVVGEVVERLDGVDEIHHVGGVHHHSPGGLDGLCGPGGVAWEGGGEIGRGSLWGLNLKNHVNNISFQPASGVMGFRLSEAPCLYAPDCLGLVCTIVAQCLACGVGRYWLGCPPNWLDQ